MDSERLHDRVWYFRRWRRTYCEGRLLDKGEVGGSSPPRPTIQITSKYAAISTFHLFRESPSKNRFAKNLPKIGSPVRPIIEGVPKPPADLQYVNVRSAGRPGRGKKCRGLEGLARSVSSTTAGPVLLPVNTPQEWQLSAPTCTSMQMELRKNSRGASESVCP